MIELVRQLRDGRRARLRFTDRSDGDLAISHPEVDDVRRQIDPRPWTWLTQVHGRTVVEVTHPGEHAGEQADGSITSVTGAVLSAQGADCPPIGLWSPEGIVGVAHAGWRGLVGGVVAAAAASMRSAGASTVFAALGPCIHPESYEFGSADLDQVVSVLGPTVIGRTSAGRLGLDVPAGVRAACVQASVVFDTDLDCCTSSTSWFSHRVRRDAGRHAVVVVIDEPSGWSSRG